MSASVQNVETTEVISAEVANVLDHAKVYYEASERSTKQFLGYACLCGKSLLTLKEIGPPGKFEELKSTIFPQKHRMTLARYMQFAQAVEFKCNTVLHFKDASFLLSDKPLPKTIEDELIETVVKATKGKGMIETINDWRKKTAAKHAPTPEERAADEKRYHNIFAQTVLGTLNMAQSDSGLEHLALCSDELAELIEDARIELGHKLAKLLKGRKKRKQAQRNGTL